MARAKRMNAPFEERLWAKIDKLGDDECWLWTASLSGTGYGQIKNGNRIVRAHNAVCRLVHGEPEEGQCALHSCDNKLCCNPAHLSWGNHTRNMREARDRVRVGPWQKLTEEQAAEIRDWDGPSRTMEEKFGVSRWTVTNIRRGHQWKQA